ncbi:MAG TPA: GNAT family N-acetyltransferase [Ktedonobacterales bacterium]
MRDRELLRLHLEAGWGISVPPIVGRSVDLETDGALPPWALYLAHFSGDEVAVWRPDVLSDHRVTLLRRGHEARPVFTPAIGMRREVVFQPPETLPDAPEHDARPLSASDAALLEAFEADSVSYFLDSRRGPCVGVIIDGRLASVAHASRRTARACELGINTTPEARRRGYARAATIAWTRAILAEGLTPLYSAFAWNAASLALAAACGYTPAIQGAYGPMSAASD